MEELRLPDFAPFVDEEFRLVALCERVLGDVLVGERVVVVGDFYVARVIRHDDVCR